MAQEDGNADTTQPDADTANIDILDAIFRKIYNLSVLASKLTRKQIGFVLVSIFLFFTVYYHDDDHWSIQESFLVILCIISIGVLLVALYISYDYMIGKLRPSSTNPKGLITENIESAACEEKELLLDSKTSKDDDVEIVDPPIDTVHGPQSDDAVNTTSVITEVDTSSGETQEDPTRRSVSKDQATAVERLRMRGDLDPDTTLRSQLGTVVAIDDLTSATIATHRHTGAVVIGMPNNIIIHASSQDWLEPYFNVIEMEMPADWQQVARNLGVPLEHIREVIQQHSNELWKCCHQVLNTWRKTNGRRATKEKLIQAVKETGRQDVVDKLLIFTRYEID